MEIVIADPAKNITIFVLDQVQGREKRAETARRLLGDPRFKAEQVGFVLPPKEGNPRRMEMMGGEFCGNAARSFGFFVARETGLRGRVPVVIETSGAEAPLTVTVDSEAGTAEVEIPKPLAVTRVEIRDGEPAGRGFPLVIFNGIVHAVAPDVKPGEKTFFHIKTEIEKRFSAGSRNPAVPEGKDSPDALGVMFFDTGRRFMTPAVYVAATESLVFESSCGSGAAALAVWETRDAGDGESRLEVKQPGGIIEARVCRKNGEITGIYIGGPVNVSGKILV
jgi:diaminopimelate epimerase